MKSTFFTILLVLGSYIYAENPESLAKAQQFAKSQKAAFEENKGQVTGADAPHVKFHYRKGGLSVFLLEGGIAYQFTQVHYPEGYKHLDKFATEEERKAEEALREQIRTETYRMDVVLEGANPQVEITSEGKSSDYIQYYNHDALNVHSYEKVTYHNVYPHIDWVVYTEGENLKYDFIVHPGGNPSDIHLKTKWVETLSLNPNGSLIFQNRMGSIEEQAPVSFQGKEKVATRFLVEGENISFLLSDYDKTRDLVIDPLLWATYYGGNSVEWGYECTADALGNIYLSGSTESAMSIALGGHQNTLGGAIDAFLVKFDMAGGRLWATYYGGTGDDSGNSCTVDSSGNVYLIGETNSLTSISSFSGYQNTYGGVRDAFLVKFDATGVRQWATYYGGSGFEYGNSCAVDVLGNVYLTGKTESFTSIASPNGYQNTLGGGIDAFLVRFDISGVRQWGTYYGGSGGDRGYGCTVDTLGYVYLTGETSSLTSIASFDGHQSTYGGGGDAFLAKFDTTGNRQWATYYGGASEDAGRSCSVNRFNEVYMTGYTMSTSNIASLGYQNSFEGTVDAFLVKFNSTGTRQWGTYYGGDGYDVSGSCTTDEWGNVYIAGTTTSTYNIAYLGQQNTYGGNYDLFLTKFDSGGVRQWGTYLGGDDYDYGYSCTSDAFNSVYLAGAPSSDFLASGGYQNTIAATDAILAKYDGSSCSQMDTATISVVASASEICFGSSVVFTASVTNEGSHPSYQWMINGLNVGIDAPVYTASSLLNTHIVSCILTSNAGCLENAIVASNQITLIVNALPATPSITQNGSTLASSASTGNQWYAGANLISGATGSTYSPTASGVYSVCVSSAAGCTTCSASFNYIATGIEEENISFTLYPNPVSETLYLEFANEGQRFSYSVLNDLGQVLSQGSSDTEITSIATQNWTPGVYFLQIETQGKHYTQKVVKQ